MANLSEKQSITIIGGGLAGLVAIKVLLRAGKSVHLVTTDSAFTFLPLLPELTTGKRSLDNLRFVYTNFLNRPNFKLTVAQVTKVDLQRRVLFIGQDKIDFDYLLNTTGAHTDQAKITGASQALVLNTWQQAQAIKEQLFKNVNNNKLAVNIIGAGFTGIELSLEIAEYLQQQQVNYIINLIHSNKHLVPWLPSEAVNIIKKTLLDNNIKLFLQQRVQAIGPHYILTNQANYRADLNILTTGIVANSQLIPDKYLNQQAEVVVNSYLQLNNCAVVWAAGDVIGFGLKSVPKLAQTAIQQGQLAAKNILRSQAGQALIPYQPKIKGLFISLGTGRALGNIGSKLVFGRWPWLLWRIIYFLNIPGLVNRWQLVKSEFKRF